VLGRRPVTSGRRLASPAATSFFGSSYSRETARGQIFRARDGRFTEVWHSEDVPGMLRQLGLEPPVAIMRFVARRSARRYRKELAVTGA
jgi:hypothetical protein